MNKTRFILLNLVLLSVLAFCPRPYSYDVEKGIECLNKNANLKSKGLCAQFVRKALEAGGCSTWGHPMCAKGYTDFLPYLDFTEMNREHYKPKAGDIVVFKAVKGHPYGHIAMWNGKQWISDFKQRSKFVATAYSHSDDYHYYRMEKKAPWRRFTWRHHVNGIAIQPMAIAAEKAYTGTLNWWQNVRTQHYLARK